jgi:hypothetical protein
LIHKARNYMHDLYWFFFFLFLFWDEKNFLVWLSGSLDPIMMQQSFIIRRLNYHWWDQNILGGGEGGSECEWVSHSGCGFVSVRKCHVIIMWNSNPDIVEIPKLDATEDQGMIFTHTCLYSCCCCCCWGEVVGSCSIIARLLAGCRINNPSR